MASGHVPVKLQLAQGQLTANQAVNLSTDTFMAMWVKAGTGLPSLSSTGAQYVADITATNAEDTLIGSRQTLTGVTWSIVSGVPAWSFSTITWAQAAGDDGLSRYLVIYDSTLGTNDAAHPVVYVGDPGGTVSAVTGAVTVSAPAGGLITFTGGG